MERARILVAVSNRELSARLRSGLERSDESHIIIEVPSGEEVLLELGRGPLDLLVTDDQLPGVAGLELLEKAQHINPDLKSILITGEDPGSYLEQGEAFGVLQILTHPVDVDLFFQALEKMASEPALPDTELEVEEGDQDPITQKLESLRSDIGAGAVFLIDERGHVVLQAGKLLVLNLGAAFPSMMEAMEASRKTSRVMGSVHPEALLFFRGASHDLYLTNVSPSHAMLIAYQGQQDPDTIRAVQEHVRRTAAELIDVMEGIELRPKPVERYAELVTNRKAGEEMPEEETQEGAETTPEPALDVPDENVPEEEVEDFWASVISETKLPHESEEGISYKEAREMGLVEDDPSSASE